MNATARSEYESGIDTTNGIGSQISPSRSEITKIYPHAETKAEKVFVRGYSLLQPDSGLVYKTYEEALYILFNKQQPSAAELNEIKQKIKKIYTDKPSLDLSLLSISGLEKKPLILLQMIILSLAYEEDTDKVSLITHIFIQIAHLFNRFVKRPFVEPNPDLSLIENLLYMIGKDYQNPELLTHFTSMMIAWMDMGLAPSAIATRINTASRADTISSLAAGVANMTGEKHTSARIKSMRLLNEIEKTLEARALSPIHDKNQAEHIIQEILQTMLDKDEFVSGFGHYIFKGLDDNGIDPRIYLVEQAIQNIYPENNMLPIINIMREIFAKGVLTHHHKTIILPPNSDIYWSGFLNHFFQDYEADNMDTMASLFNILTRISGLLAHDQEQRQTKYTVKIWGWITE